MWFRASVGRVGAVLLGSCSERRVLGVVLFGADAS